MTQQEIIEKAYRLTRALKHPAINPYPRTSMESRYWQDGVRKAMQDLEEGEISS